MWRCLILCLLTSAAVAQTSRPTAAPADPAVVQRLITELGADEADTRIAAQDKLTALGSGALSQLKHAVETTGDPEVRSRLQDVIATLKRADRSGPTLVTMRSRGVPPKAALDSLRDETGVDIGVWPPQIWRHGRFKPVTVEGTDLPFWVAVMSICDQAGLQPQPHDYGRGGRIVLGQSQPTDTPRPQYYRDGFLFTPTAATRTHAIQYARSDDPTVSSNIQMNILIDPRMTVLQGPTSIVVTEAVDENGLSLVPARQDAQMYAAQRSATLIWPATVALDWKPGQGKVLKRFKGTGSFMVVEESEKWEIDLTKFKRAEKTVAGVTFSVDSFGNRDQSYNLKVTLQFPKPANPQQMPQNPLANWSAVGTTLRFVDDRGNTFASRGGGGGSTAIPGKYSFNYSCVAVDDNGTPIGAPTKLIWTLPVSIKRLDIPFELTDVPIP